MDNGVNMETGVKTDKENIGHYDPFEHREVEKPNSDIRSLANLVKASLGSGILAVPLAFANSGWALGLAGTFVIAFACMHCVQIFVTSSRALCRLEQKPLLGYAETCKAAFRNGPKRIRPFAHTAKMFADFALIFTYLGVCCIFTILMADSIKQIVDRYMPGSILAVEYYCLMLLVPLCLMVQIRHLKFLAPFSLLANVLLISTFGICLYYIFDGGLTIADKKLVGDAARFPVFLSTVIFAMEGIGVVMPVENTMKQPQHFLGCPGVLVVAMAIITVLYAFLGLFGYLRYGDVLRGSITLNLPMDEWPAIAAKVFIIISLFFTYPIHFYVVVDMVTKRTKSRIKPQYQNVVIIATRIGIVIFCGVIALVLPMLEQVINIVGALFYSLLGLILPGIIETIVRWDSLGRCNWVLWKNLMLVTFGFGCMVSGLHVTVADIHAILNRKTV